MRRRLVLVPIVALFAFALSIAPTVQSALAAAPPGPFFQGFEKNRDNWFDTSNGWLGTLTRQQNGYVSSGYASGIQSAAGRWHARLTGEPPCDQTQSGVCFGPYTDLGGDSSTFPPGGYIVQVDVYLDVGWAATHNDYRFDWDTAINNNTGGFLRDYVFNVGTQLPPLYPGPGFYVNASTNALRSGAFPENPCPAPNTPPNSCRMPILISGSGWYSFRHTFRDAGGTLAVDFDVIRRANGVTVGHWTIYTDPMSIVGGNSYGWFATEEIPQLAIDNSLRTGRCRAGEGDGDFEDKDGHKHHAKFHQDSCNNGGGNNGGGGDVEDDDNNSGKHFQSTSTDSATYSSDENSETLTMVGTGLDDGLPVGFTMVAVDFHGVTPAVYTLTLTDGRTFTGTLVSGLLALD